MNGVMVSTLDSDLSRVQILCECVEPKLFAKGLLFGAVVAHWLRLWAADQKVVSPSPSTTKLLLLGR